MRKNSIYFSAPSLLASSRHFTWSGDGTVKLSFEISLFEQNFYQYVTVCLTAEIDLQKCGRKSAYFSRRKNVKKRSKNDTLKICPKLS